MLRNLIKPSRNEFEIEVCYLSFGLGIATYICNVIFTQNIVNIDIHIVRHFVLIPIKVLSRCTWPRSTFNVCMSVLLKLRRFSYRNRYQYHSMWRSFETICTSSFELLTSYSLFLELICFTFLNDDLEYKPFGLQIWSIVM